MKTRRSLTCGIVKKIAVVVVSEKKNRNIFLEEWFVLLLPNVVLEAQVTKAPLVVDNLKSILSLNQWKIF